MPVDIRIKPERPRGWHKQTARRPFYSASYRRVKKVNEELFERALKEVEERRVVGSNHVQTTRSLLAFALENGMTLQQCTDPRFMNRKIGTLKRYVRRFGMSFPDYVPRKAKNK